MQARFEAHLQEPDLHQAKYQVLSSLQNHWSGPQVFVDRPEVAMGRVDDWRGVRRLPVAVVAPFGDDASVRLALAPFPAAARRTGRATLPHPALIQDLTSSRSTGFYSALAA
jgi:hypothetical protein